ncbi:MAG: polymer-forming cytoskeletal protein [Clostridiales Family XIII bacterium]|nr:polymer-forming cytoskeletal protein [Clostridiales Family XIII bacterium]
MGIFDRNKQGITKFFGIVKDEKSTAEYVKPGASPEGLEARLENDYEEELASIKKADVASSFSSDVAQLDVAFTAEDPDIPAVDPPQTPGGYSYSSEVGADQEALHDVEETTDQTGSERDVYAEEASAQNDYNAEDGGENKMSNEVSAYENESEKEEDSKKGNSLSHISEEAIIHGDIATEGHLEVLGKVKGNIEAKGNIAIQGDIKGNIEGSKIGLYNCKIKGNLDARIGVVADTTSLIVGDVKTKSLIIDGRLKGDIEAENIVVIKENGYFLGDIVTGALSIENGAIVNGNIRTLVEGDVEAPFEE